MLQQTHLLYINVYFGTVQGSELLESAEMTLEGIGTG